MMYKIKTLNKISQTGLDLFSSDYTITDDLTLAHGVLVRSQDMHSMELSENILAIARAGAGVNNIPIDSCSKKGIVVFNTPGANANAVKELVLTGLFLASRDVVKGCSWVKTLTENISKAVEKGKGQFAGHEIQGKTLGVLGLGAIGVMVANSASQLGMKVVGFDPYLSIHAALELSNKISLCDSMETLVSQCDYLSVHVPASASTKGMIDQSIFHLMKDGTCLLNFSRDSIVNDEDLLQAIAEGKIHRYVTDFPNETVAHGENVIAIPHLGASTEESEENCAAMAVTQLMDYIENGNITNSVNLPNCSMGICGSQGRIAVIHENKPAMIGTITGHLASLGINIGDMTNRGKGDYQYTLVDLDSP
ncbi:MAG: 3-phosphoglycerate dehydrogenase family protein, partial [Anaerovorax sp.]